ncbi:MAG: hypothetical protein HC850_08520 [Rhodomicrobium sp.]|nr:hypothetical protein [Rhodomicrobium sp.]
MKISAVASARGEQRVGAEQKEDVQRADDRTDDEDAGLAFDRQDIAAIEGEDDERERQEGDDITPEGDLRDIVIVAEELREHVMTLKRKNAPVRGGHTEKRGVVRHRAVRGWNGWIGGDGHALSGL